eukprot:5618493-Pleurochrysis_carterae.AAC.1
MCSLKLALELPNLCSSGGQAATEVRDRSVLGGGPHRASCHLASSESTAPAPRCVAAAWARRCAINPNAAIRVQYVGRLLN